MPVCDEVTIKVVAPGAPPAEEKPSFEEALKSYAKKYGPLALLALLAYYAFRR